MLRQHNDSIKEVPIVTACTVWTDQNSSRPTKTNKTSFPLEFDRFGQPKKDTQRILSDAEFVLVVCLPECDHVKAINNLRIAWHGPMSDKEFVLIQALYRTPNKYNFQMKIVWPHENYFSKEFEAIVVLNLREVCNEQEINDLRMPFAFNATMQSRNIKKDVTKRNKKVPRLWFHSKPTLATVQIKMKEVPSCNYLIFLLLLLCCRA